MEWIPILMEEVGEACRHALEDHFKPDPLCEDRFRSEMVQVAAVAQAAIETIDHRNRAFAVFDPGREEKR